MPKLNKWYTVSKRLASRYKKAKEFEKKLKEDKQRFFNLATEANEKVDKPRVTVQYLGTSVETAQLVAERHPAHDVIHMRQVGDGEVEMWEYILEPSAEFMPFKYVDPDLGLVFEKEIRQGTIMLDEERLQAENPELWDRITETITVVSDPDTFDEDDTAAIQPYVYRAKPTVALRAPRKAKEDEL